ncbi:MAG: glycosyltransferase family 2 protein [Bradymonadaceae bacterium]|nr:glycosyltransferase family 2 protein [Lujinxingiaceae bacterium]
MTTYIDLFIFAYCLMLALSSMFLIVFAVVEITRRKATRMPELDEEVLSEVSTPPIAVIAPSYNEQVHIVECVRGFLGLDYPQHEVIVVNDGSTDATLERLIADFELEECDRFVQRQIPTSEVRAIYRSRQDARLWVVDKVNGGKADALNVGINLARCPLVCCVDADTILAKDALLRLVEPYLYDPQGVVAVGGTVRIINGCKVEDSAIKEIALPSSWLARFQIVEYLGAFLFGRMGFNRLGGNVIISGAVGLFLRTALVEAGGYARDTIGEDAELVIRLHRRECHRAVRRKVVQIPEPICFTEAPEDLATFARQRDRWHRGLADALWKHRAMFFSPRYGRTGMLVLPWFLVFELLAPLVELLGYLWLCSAVAFGFISWPMAGVFLLIALAWGLILSLQSILIDNWSFNVFRSSRSRIGLVLTAILFNVGYRHLTLVCRLSGLARYMIGSKTWGVMKRKGFRRLGAA